MKHRAYISSHLALSRTHIAPALLYLVMAAGYCVAIGVSKPWGWALLAACFPLSLGLLRKQALAYYLMLLAGISIVLLMPPSIHPSLIGSLFACGIVILSLAVPYVASRLLYKHSPVHFELDFSRRWTREQIAVVIGSIITCTVFMALYFLTSDAHKFWPLTTPSDIMAVFCFIMLFGMWEEFFFIATMFGILQRFLPTLVANAIQALMFCGFLYQFGFRGWIVPLTFVYAFTQGFVYHKFNSLLINVTIHFFVDLAVFVLLLVSAQL